MTIVTLKTLATSERSPLTTCQKTIGKFNNNWITSKQEKTVAANRLQLIFQIQIIYTETPLNCLIKSDTFRLRFSQNLGLATRDINVANAVHSGNMAFEFCARYFCFKSLVTDWLFLHFTHFLNWEKDFYPRK